jgi:glycosyltransferase involved in cell wall biosynthesis
MPQISMGPERSRIRVALVAPSTAILGGQAVQARRLLDAWSHDADVRAWLVPINPMPPGPLGRAIGVKYLRTVVTQATYWPLLARELRHADVVHVFSASYLSFLLAPLPAVLIAKALKRPVVLNYRSGEAPDHLARSRIARETLARVDRNVVPSRFLADLFARFGLAADIVPNIVDLDAFRFRRREPVRPAVLSTRNFEPLYNVACTLRAFRVIQLAHPDATLTLVGGGSEEPALRRLADHLGLRRVRFVGRVPPGEISRFYAEADIYLQTPDIDNMPGSVLEAFASGLPVVSTAAGGVPAILTDEVHGLLVPPGDHAAAARAVLRLVDEAGLADRLSQAASATCRDYTWRAVRDRWLAVYRSVLAQDGARAPRAA